MAGVEAAATKNDDSEMEEGEIVDDIDDLSDISSEEEFLLRQRLQVLENYNNVLERKKAKRSSIDTGRHKSILPQEFSEFVGKTFENNFSHSTSRANVILGKNARDHKHIKTHRQKKRKDLEPHRDFGKDKKKTRRKRLEVKVISESSEESEDEYKNKRRKLADAVVVDRNKNDKTSLQERLQRMFAVETPQPPKPLTVDKITETDTHPKVEDVACSPIVSISVENVPENIVKHVIEEQGKTNSVEVIEVSTDDDVFITNIENVNTVDPPVIGTVEKLVENQEQAEAIEIQHKNNESDDDIELLRQHALKTKASNSNKIVTKEMLKIKKDVVSGYNKFTLSEDEDSDTTELRLICLKSALLKKAIERKQKQKLKKRLSHSLLEDEIAENNNTDIETVDMEIGSDGDEKIKDVCNLAMNNKGIINQSHKVMIAKVNTINDEELEEDEDLLRAKLLTSLSKNLPNLVDPNQLSTEKAKPDSPKQNTLSNSKVSKPEENRIVIKVGESDSEGEHEATKNLTKMHMKLSVNDEFQQKLDLFLKDTWMQVEKSKQLESAKKESAKLEEIKKPEVVLETEKLPQKKYVPKAVKHLPREDQIEYQKLLKKMAELEKIKKMRQSSMALMKPQIKETLKPRNVSSESANLIILNHLEDQFAQSRKNIAEESAQMLKLKEEATNLSQKYKIVATELRNIATAITFNKKQQRAAQNRLSKIRIQHQRLLNSATSKHSKVNSLVPSTNIVRPKIYTAKLQKENTPAKGESKNPSVLTKTVKIINVVNGLISESIAHSKRPVDVSHKKIENMPDKDKTNEKGSKNSKIDIVRAKQINEKYANCLAIEGARGDVVNDIEQALLSQMEEKDDDYESPLQALGSASWEGDPHAILCPFDVCGQCKDPDCKYLHTKIPLPQ